MCPNKAPTPKTCLTNVVYKISCEACRASYIGQTARMLKERMDEHKRRGGIISQHTIECNGSLNIKEEVLCKLNNSFEARIAEAIFIAFSIRAV